MPSSGDPCEGEAMCSYGTETCCGNTYPSYRCECRDDGFVCMYTDACLIPGCEDASTALPDAAVMCPTAMPFAGDGCGGAMHCEYGSETCCGKTHPSYVCDCREGRFDCLYTDACLIPGCPDAAVD
jgi:hypothetical protein